MFTDQGMPPSVISTSGETPESAIFSPRILLLLENTDTQNTRIKKLMRNPPPG